MSSYIAHLTLGAIMQTVHSPPLELFFLQNLVPPQFLKPAPFSRPTPLAAPYHFSRTGTTYSPPHVRQVYQSQVRIRSMSHITDLMFVNYRLLNRRTFRTLIIAAGRR